MRRRRFAGSITAPAGALNIARVGPGRKRRSLAGHDEHAAFAIVADSVQTLLEIEDDAFIEAVAPLRPIERDRRDRPSFSTTREVFSRLPGAIVLLYFDAALGRNSSLGLRASDRY